jgi:hypothetical protein
MHTSNPHSHNTILTSVVLGAVLALVFMFATVTGAYAANNTPGPAFDAFTGTGSGVGSLVVPLANPPASALTRTYQSSFGSFSFGDPQALTVDQATGDVYAVSPSAGTVSRYTSAGAPDDFTAGPDKGTNTLTGFSFDTGPSATEIAIAPTGAVGGTAGDIYIASFAGVDVRANDGEDLGQITQANGAGFEEACGVATDTTGKVYVGDYGGKIDRYLPSANPVTNGDYDAQISGVSQPCNVAADSTGAVYASSFESNVLKKYTASEFGTSEPGTPIAAHSHAIAVDPTTDELYVDEGGSITVFSSAGESQYRFGSTEDFGGQSAGIAVAGSGGDAYVADNVSHRVDVFGPAAAPPPTATTSPATGVHHASATLNGHLDPAGNGAVTDCHFEYGLTTGYGSSAPCSQGNSFSDAADVSASIAGLEPSRTYHFRLSVARGTSTAKGADATFETVPVPVVHALSSSFGSTGTGDGQFSGNSGIAIDQATRDIYVADTGNHRVERFDSTGKFISAFGWGVKDGTAEAQVCTAGCQAGIAGEGAGQLRSPEFIAVDNSGGPSDGDVYVADTADSKVSKFDAEGKYLSTTDGSSAPNGPFSELSGVAVDPSGNLYVLDSHPIFEFTPNGTYTREADLGCCVTPHGLAIDSHDNFYRVRGSDQAQKFNASFEDSNPAFGENNATGIATDPSNDDLYIANPSGVSRYSTTEKLIETFGSGNLTAANGIAVDATTGTVDVSDPDTVKTFGLSAVPEVTTGAAVAGSGTAATLNGAVSTNGVNLTDCHFEYVTDIAFSATGYSDLSSGGSLPCNPAGGSLPTDFEAHAVTANVTGLNPADIYHFRLVATNPAATVDGEDALIPGLSLVETTGSPTRTATTARLDSRLDPHATQTTYHFEYGTSGPCDANPCTSTPPLQAGHSGTYELVSQQLTGLTRNTTYHYRLVAENSTPNSTEFGQDATLTTRANDTPLTHGKFPGPPGSDRAWEQVNIPDTGGNPVQSARAISENGERVSYTIDGGSPGSRVGGGETASNDQYAERSSKGWRHDELFPTRREAPGNVWKGPHATDDLSRMYFTNFDVTNTGPDETWSVKPDGKPQMLLNVPVESQLELGLQVSEETISIASKGTRVLQLLGGTVDSVHPVDPRDLEIYDLTSGTPHMAGFLPDGSVPICPVAFEAQVAQQQVTPDGSHAFFQAYPTTDCVGQRGLFVRDLENPTTTQIAAHAAFDRYAGESAFFTTEESLVPADHGGLDLYRYDVNDASTICVTCATPFAGIVEPFVNTSPFENIAISDDGSHAYLQSKRSLLRGAAAEGIYRLDVSTGALAYVAPGGFKARTGNAAEYNALSPDGRFFVFLSSNPSLDARNGQHNGGTLQAYRYDDRDGSLVCASCPGDGSAPVAGITGFGRGRGTGSTSGALTTSGSLFFATPTPLSTFDQNTARAGQEPRVGNDVYEWRDGQLLLVTDGEGSGEPVLDGVSADGRNVFFTEAAQLTPETPDAQARLYDARIGGGFEFPTLPPPCSLETCQGIPTPPPNDPAPASSTFSGPSNQNGSAGSTTSTAPAHRTAAQLRAARLAKALKACRRGGKKAKRVACERNTRKKYGPVKRGVKRATNKRRGH